MKISFAYLGNLLGVKKLLERLGHEVIFPPKPTQNTFALGVKYSPEFLCYPFKVMTGTYLELAEMGVEAVIAPSQSGPCRLGYYNELQKRIMRQSGHAFEFFDFDSIFKYPKEFFDKVRRLANGKLLYAIPIIYYGFRIIECLDHLEARLKHLRAYEINKGEFNKVWREINEMFDNCKNLHQVNKAYRKGKKMLESVPIRHVDPKDRMVVGIIGEIYVAMESSTNMDIEQKLNDMGIEVENANYISEWVWMNIIPRRINPHKGWKVTKYAKKYSSMNCGGHDDENMGWVIDFSKRDFLAAVHIMPFACLPELVTRSVLPKIAEDYHFPVLSVSMDEQNGAANFQTRLEAFIELAKGKKALKNGEFPMTKITEKVTQNNQKSDKKEVKEKENIYA